MLLSFPVSRDLPSPGPAPRMHVRGPTRGVLDDVDVVRRLRDLWIEPSGVETPSVLAVNLEGAFPTPDALVELVLPMAKTISSGSYGQLALVFCTPNESTRMILRALAESQGLSFFIADAVDAISDAEPAGPLTAAQIDTLERLRKLGGQATASVFAAEASLEPSAATNRLVGLRDIGLVQVHGRSRREGAMYLDPRSAVPDEEPTEPLTESESAEDAWRALQALAEHQGRTPDELYAQAVRDFVDRYRGQLGEEHEAVRNAIEDEDVEAIQAAARRYARRAALSERRRKLK